MLPISRSIFLQLYKFCTKSIYWAWDCKPVCKMSKPIECHNPCALEKRYLGADSLTPVIKRLF